jgi:hypothetical protein
MQAAKAILILPAVAIFVLSSIATFGLQAIMMSQAKDKRSEFWAGAAP